MAKDPRQPIDLTDEPHDPDRDSTWSTLEGAEEIGDLMDEKDLHDLLVEPDDDPENFLLDGDVPITLP